MLFFVGCVDKKSTLSLYTWDDYIDPSIISDFEKEYDCDVVIDVFDSNEAMYSKLQYLNIGYDIILPSSYQIVMMKNANMIDKLDYSLLPNVKKYFDTRYEKLLISEIKDYSVPYAFSMTSIAFRTDKINFDLTSWSDIDKLNITNNICLFNDMREIIGASLKCLGFSANTTNKTELFLSMELAKKWKRKIIKMDNEAWKSGIMNGEFNVVMAYNSDIFQIMNDLGDSSKIKFVIMKEGILSCFDEFVISKNSKNKELAHKFIDFIYRPDIAKRNIEYILAVMPNCEAVKMLPDNMKHNELIVPSENILDKCEIIKYLDGNIYDLYINVWDKIKASK